MEKELRPIRARLDVLEEKAITLQEDITDLKAGQKRLENGVQAILKYMEGTDETLREHRTNPDRIARLERSVFR